MTGLMDVGFGLAFSLELAGAVVGETGDVTTCLISLGFFSSVEPRRAVFPK
jgi:hypothetical protein